MFSWLIQVRFYVGPVTWLSPHCSMNYIRQKTQSWIDWVGKINQHPSTISNGIKLYTCSFFLPDFLGFSSGSIQHLQNWNEFTWLPTSNDAHAFSGLLYGAFERLESKHSFRLRTHSDNIQGLNCPLRKYKTTSEPEWVWFNCSNSLTWPCISWIEALF